MNGFWVLTIRSNSGGWFLHNPRGLPNDNDSKIFSPQQWHLDYFECIFCCSHELDFFLDQITLLIGLGKVLSSQVILTNSWCRKESRKRWFKGELWALYLHEKSSTNFTQIPKQLRHEKAIHSITLVKSFVQPCFSHFLQWV